MALTKDSPITVDSDILKYTFEINMSNLLEDTEWDDFSELHKLAVNEIIDWLLLEGITVSNVTNSSDFKRAAIYHLCSTVFLGVSQRPDDEYWMKHAAYAAKFEAEMTKQLVQLQEGTEHPRSKKIVVKNLDTNGFFNYDANPNT